MITDAIVMTTTAMRPLAWSLYVTYNIIVGLLETHTARRPFTRRESLRSTGALSSRCVGLLTMQSVFVHMNDSVESIYQSEKLPVGIVVLCTCTIPSLSSSQQ